LRLARQISCAGDLLGQRGLSESDSKHRVGYGKREPE
jgi:hypothetical protein